MGNCGIFDLMHKNFTEIVEKDIAFSTHNVGNCKIFYLMHKKFMDIVEKEIALSIHNVLHTIGDNQ